MTKPERDFRQQEILEQINTLSNSAKIAAVMGELLSRC